MFKTAKWIGRAVPSAGFPKEEIGGDFAAPLLKKRFALEKPVARARLHYCGVGYAEVRINGERVTADELTTPITAYDKTLLYSTYEVGGMLVAGGNEISALLGNGWYNNESGLIWDFQCAPWRAYPKLIACLGIEYSDGTGELIATDSSWKASKSPLLYSHTRCGEFYDARLEGGCAGGDAGGCAGDDPDAGVGAGGGAGESDALVVRSPGGILKPVGGLPPIRVTDVFPMRKISGSVYDCGQNISGWARIRARGERGAKIVLKYAERLDGSGQISAGDINAFSAQAKSALCHTDVYVMKGGGWETWQPRFAYHGFRYVEVDGAPADFEIEACFVRTDLPIVGEFECSDGMLNKIHKAARLATLSNYHSIPTDCPHREQNGWTGDAAISAEQALMNYDMSAAYKKWLADFKDVQRASGQLPGIVPTGGWGFNWGNGPAWDAALFLIPAALREYTGDSSLIADMWENMERYMGFIETMAEGYIVEFGLGDWCPPKDAKACPVALTDTAYYFVFAREMAENARLLGKKSDEGKYAALARNIRDAFRARFFKGGVVESDGQTAWSCAIYQGLLDEGEIPAAVGRLSELVEEKGGHLDVGILGAKYLFTALADSGRSDLVYRMVANPTCPSYAHWINSGMTTLCENWDMGASQNHHMFSDVDLWFYRSLAGLRPGERGFGKAVIKPEFLENLDWVAASHCGYAVEWRRENGAVELSVTVPPRGAATVALPGGSREVGEGTHRFAIGAK
ncbi:MAG: glycoside hydrolase family 78 protein [Clostridiales bacterium]|jgi:alpha-L-rhamnosidase|nr:glycoside hydrolase family 78 protein [Clostridiales bacterium]